MKLVLYYKEQRIKTINVNDMPFNQVIDLILPINVYFKKHIFASNFVGIVVTPYALKFNKDDKMHVEVKLMEGVRISG